MHKNVMCVCRGMRGEGGEGRVHGERKKGKLLLSAIFLFLFIALKKKQQSILLDVLTNTDEKKEETAAVPKDFKKISVKSFFFLSLATFVMYDNVYQGMQILCFHELLVKMDR